MAEMIKKVATAMCAHDGPGNTFAKLDTQDQAYFLRLARWAIEAMRDATDAMLERGCEPIRDWDYDFESSIYPARECWTAMINEALK